MYCCVLINEWFFAMDKTLKLRVVVRKTLYSSMVILMDLYLRKLSCCFHLASSHTVYMLELLAL